MDFQALADDLGFELEEFMELAELFIETASADLTTIFKAIENNDAMKAAKAIHSIKGAAGNLGFTKIHELAKQMEVDAKNNRFIILLESSRALNDELNLLSKQIRN
ncbi:MAG: Hpt domain-containing protein [Thermodesulfobacteriota bacterium]